MNGTAPNNIRLEVGSFRGDLRVLRLRARSSGMLISAWCVHCECMVAQLRPAWAVWGSARLQSASVKTGTFALAAGTATFLSAGADGSHLRAQTSGDEIGAMSDRGEAVFSAAVDRHGGVRPIEEGHWSHFVAAFARASEAVACALDIQRQGRAEELPRLRIGLHTGEAQLLGKVRYLGQTPARAGRLSDLGHAGQVLLSRTCADLVVDHLPAAASLADLGAHRMRDLSRPAQVYQLCHPNIVGGFPPLRSLDRHPHNLAVQLTSFVGREAAVAEVGALVANNGLVTITGSGGCGKTRLAQQVAAEALGATKDEAWFVDLSGLADPGLVPATVMAAMGMREVHDQSHTDTLTTWLADRAALIVLDNCEHMLAATSALAEALLLNCGPLGVLTTSREQLGVAGEVVWRVPSLSVPAERAPADIRSLDASEAARLFRDRARAARPNFAITNENAPAVAAICQRLDGIPLAIELAAARARMMSVERIADSLVDRFHLLAGGGRTVVPRQATLRASVGWSYELLPEPERVLLQRLSVFAGGFSLDGAEQVVAAEDLGRYHVLGLLSALIDKSLVQVNDSGDRYRLLETIRAYAAEELAGSGEEVPTRDRHLSFFAKLGARAEKGMQTSETARWLSLLDAEHDNVRAAIDWSLASGQPGTGARLASAIGQFLYIRRLRTEGLRQCEDFLSHELAPARRAELYWCAARFAMFSDHASTLRYGEALVSLGRELGDDKAVARGLDQVGRVQMFSDPLAALGTLGEALATARSVGDSFTEVDCLCRTADAYHYLDHFGEALRCAEEALAIAQRSADPWGTGFATVQVATAARELGQLDRAATYCDALMAEGVDDQFFAQSARWCRGIVGVYRSDPSAAEDLSAARELAERTHDDVNLGDIRGWQGALALALGQEAEGRRVLEEAAALADPFRPVTGARIRCLLAEAAIRRGDLLDAGRWLDEAIELPSARRLALVMKAQARLARAKGDHRRASQLVDDGMGAARRSGARLLVVDFLELLALLAGDTGRFVEAGRLLGATATERERLGYARFAVYQPEVELTMANIRSALGTAAFAAASSDGLNLSIDEAVDYARRRRGRRDRPSSGWASLTPTEQKVVELVVEGLSNEEIGARMFVSTPTVKSHLNHVFGKLEVTNRRELASVARAMSV
jgi:predicted ATPase/DNA-binding CsgD family transcriptional regulator